MCCRLVWRSYVILVHGSLYLVLGCVAPAEQVGRRLGLTVVNMRFIKPLDRTLLLELARTHEVFVTIEDNVVAGGAGSGVAELLNAEGIVLPIVHLGLPDAFQQHASREDLLAEAGIDAAGVYAALLSRWPDLAVQNHPLSASELSSVLFLFHLL